MRTASLAAAAALPGGTAELAGQLIPRLQSGLFEMAQRELVEPLDTAFGSFEAGIEPIEFLDQAGKALVALAQTLQFHAQLGKRLGR